MDLSNILPKIEGEKMKFSHVTISVSDLEATVKFYKELVGLSVEREFAAGPNTIVFLGDGGTSVELISSAASSQSAIASDLISLGFSVESLEEKINELKASGITDISEITSPNPQTRFFFTHDPAGVRIQFIQS
jgi:lactoylglutathione lyase